MLNFVSKEHYWDVLDRGVDKKFEQIGNWHLKNIQDCAIADLMDGVKGKKIAEIGGAGSRMLKWLANENEVYNIEPFEGVGNGISRKIEVDGVKNVYCYLGDSEEHIEDNSFDVIFSVSVVEHVLDDQLIDFIKDCRRVLKPGGKMFHAVDMYLVDDSNDERCSYNLVRINEYLRAFENGRFTPLETPKISTKSDVCFSSSYASNPDNMMRQWNNSAPGLKELRKRAQSVTLLWCGQK